MTDLYSKLPAEIQQAILQVLVDGGEKKYLATALRVNKSWFANCVPILYRTLPDLRGIFGAVGSPNLDRYLSNICHIVFEGGCYTKDLKKTKDTNLNLPNLRFISVEPPFVPRGTKQNYEEEYSLEPILALLRPSVRVFSCIGGILTREFLTALKEKCPHLEKLELKFMRSHNVRNIDEDYLRHWLRDMPSVHSVSIFNLGNISNGHRDELIEELVSDDLLSDLLDRPLKTLGLECYLEKLGRLGDKEIFYSLRDLRVVLRQDIFGSIPRFRHLRNLHVRIDGLLTETLFPSIASLTHLKSLKIIFGGLPTLQTEDIMLLGNLHALKRLEIRSSQRGRIRSYNDKSDIFLPIEVPESFDEDCFYKLVSSFPNMWHLFLLFDWVPDSFRVLKSVATTCPNIEYLGLGYNIDIHESLMNDRKPVFPCLKRFTPVRKITMDVSGGQFRKTR
jgi:hypothetical protein